MIRLGKLTDYGIVLMTHMARRTGEVHTARDLALRAHVPAPTVSKLLKSLMQGGLLSSTRGVNGGYALARPPEDISVAQVIVALEGPIAITECMSGDPGLCSLEGQCPAQGNWRTINNAIRQALEKLTLAEMAGNGSASPARKKTAPPPINPLAETTP